MQHIMTISQYTEHHFVVKKVYFFKYGAMELMIGSDIMWDIKASENTQLQDRGIVLT